MATAWSLLCCVPHHLALVVACAVMTWAVAPWGLATALVLDMTPSTAVIKFAIWAHISVYFNSLPHPRCHDALLDQSFATCLPFTTQTSYNLAFFPFCLFSLMVRGFDSHHTWVGIVLPLISASNYSHIFSRPSVLFANWHPGSTARIFRCPLESFSLTSITPFITVLAALMMISEYSRTITAVAFCWVMPVITRLAFLYTFMIQIWARAYW